MQKFLTTTSQISAQPGEVCHPDLTALADCLPDNKSAPRNKFYICFTKPHFSISHCLPDSSGSPWATSATFVSQDRTWPWHSAPLFLNLHLQAITQSVISDSWNLKVTAPPPSDGDGGCLLAPLGWAEAQCWSAAATLMHLAGHRGNALEKPPVSNFSAAQLLICHEASMDTQLLKSKYFLLY